MATVENCDPFGPAPEVSNPGPIPPPFISDAMLRVMAMGLRSMESGVQMLTLSRVAEHLSSKDERMLASDVKKLIACYAEVCNRLDCEF